MGNALSGRTNIPRQCDRAEEFTLPAEVQVAFYRVCQEALNNIAKHAKASQVEISPEAKKKPESNCAFVTTARVLTLNKDISGHYGLSMMRERAEAVGALLSVTSQPGHGTELTIRWDKARPKEAPMTIVSSQPIRVMLVDDHTMVRRGLGNFLEGL